MQGGIRVMRLNQATDYAFRMVLYLASLPEGTKITGAALAEKQNIPERFLLKIMRNLTAAGIMKSYCKTMVVCCPRFKVAYFNSVNVSDVMARSRFNG